LWKLETKTSHLTPLFGTISFQQKGNFSTNVALFVGLLSAGKTEEGACGSLLNLL